MDKPKIVFFFDEAHLLFKDAPKELLEKIEQVVRLIRSKGRWDIFYNTESDRYTRYGIISARKQNTARSQSLFSKRAESG